MVEPILMIIGVMWIPVGLFFLGKGEAKGTGVLALMVGALVIVASIFLAVVFKDPFSAALLFVYGLVYCSVGFTLYAGLKDGRSMGNASFTAALVTAVYLIFVLIGTELIAVSHFLALIYAGYLVLYIMIGLNTYGKFSGKALGWSLIIWTVVGLLWPAFSLLAVGKLPF